MPRPLDAACHGDEERVLATSLTLYMRRHRTLSISTVFIGTGRGLRPSVSLTEATLAAVTPVRSVWKTRATCDHGHIV